MKKILVLLVALFLLTGCNWSKRETSDETDPPKEKEKLTIKQNVSLVAYVNPNDTKYQETYHMAGLGEDVEITTNKGNVALYRLVTEYDYLYIVDYGFADMISQIKCQRYKDIQKEIKELQDLNKPCK